MQNYSSKEARPRSRDLYCIILGLLYIAGTAKATNFKFGMLIDYKNTIQQRHIRSTLA